MIIWLTFLPQKLPTFFQDGCNFWMISFEPISLTTFQNIIFEWCEYGLCSCHYLQFELLKCSMDNLAFYMFKIQGIIVPSFALLTHFVGPLSLIQFYHLGDLKMELKGYSNIIWFSSKMCIPFPLHPLHILIIDLSICHIQIYQEIYQSSLNYLLFLWQDHTIVHFLLLLWQVGILFIYILLVGWQVGVVCSFDFHKLNPTFHIVFVLAH